MPSTPERELAREFPDAKLPQLDHRGDPLSERKVKRPAMEWEIERDEDGLPVRMWWVGSRRAAATKESAP